MEPVSKTQAQQHADQIRSFQAEASWLEAEGVMQLSADQQDAIHTYHDALLNGFSQTFDIDRNRQAKQHTVVKAQEIAREEVDFVKACVDLRDPADFSGFKWVYGQ